jgi:hypothetical protein
LLVGACSPAVNVKDDLFDIPRGQVRILSTLEELLNEPLDPSWRKSGANDPLSDYWSIPGDTCSYLFKGGFQSVVPGEMAIRYESYPEQHHPDSNRIVLTVIREREGKYSLPQCPVYLPLVSCIENHTLMLASRVECTLKDCIYEFVVFDYFEPIRILRDPPFLNRILRDFVQGFPKHYKYEIKHQTTGHFEPRPGAGSEYEMWSEYILFHVNLVDKTVKEAARHYGGFELLNVN